MTSIEVWHILYIKCHKQKTTTIEEFQHALDNYNKITKINFKMQQFRTRSQNMQEKSPNKISFKTWKIWKDEKEGWLNQCFTN